MKTIIALLLASVLAPLASVVAAAARPNVVFIYADDLGFGDLVCHGHPSILTPEKSLPRVANYLDDVQVSLLRAAAASLNQAPVHLPRNL